VIHITISRKELVALGACLRGLEWFDSIASSGVWSSDWTPLHDVWIRKSPWCGWLVVKKLIPIANLQGADLRWAGLLGANLEGANSLETSRKIGVRVPCQGGRRGFESLLPLKDLKYLAVGSTDLTQNPTQTFPLLSRGRRRVVPLHRRSRMAAD